MGRLLLGAGIWLLALAPGAGAADWRDLPVPRTTDVAAVTPSRTVPGAVWALAGNKPVVTYDGGLTWASSVPAMAGAVADAVPTRWWRIADGADLERSDDGGGSWQAVPGLAAVEVEHRLNQGVTIKQLLADPTRSGVLYVIAFVGNDREGEEAVLASHDGGSTWAVWVTRFGVYDRYDWGFSDTWTALPGRDALLLVRVGGFGDDVHEEVDVVGPAAPVVVHYRAGRRGAGNENGGPLLGLTFTGRTVIDATGDRVLVEAKGGWELSTDGGANLRRLKPVVARGLAPPTFDSSDAHRMYALRHDQLFRSDDGGATWLALASGVRRATGLAVDAGGLVYVYGDAGLAISRDAGRTFTYVRSLGTTMLINSLREDGRGGLLAATERGVWRVGSDGQWTPAERDAFPLKAARAAPLGATLGVLVLRASTVPRLEVVNPGGTMRTIKPPPRPGSTGGAFGSDAHARRMVLGAAWTTDGGRHWQVAPARETSTALGPGGLVYATRDDARRAHRSTLWRRSGGGAWKQVASITGTTCKPVAGGAVRVYVLCADRLWRSDDGGSSSQSVAVPERLRDVTSIAVDQRQPDHIAVLLRTFGDECGQKSQDVTLTSTDGGATWLRTADACGGRYDNLTIAPDGALLRWSKLAPESPPQVLDGWL